MGIGGGAESLYGFILYETVEAARIEWAEAM